MTTYISILRGINVSGKNLIKMDALRKLYEGLGYQNVISYVQSGNVVFTSDDSNPHELELKISRQIDKDFGINVPIIVLTIERLKRIIEDNPFSKDSDKEPAFLHITFLFSQPESPNLKTIENKKQNEEEILILNDVVYLYCPNGYGRTKLTNNFLEAKMNINATTRNWKTTNELLRLAENMPAISTR